MTVFSSLRQVHRILAPTSLSKRNPKIVEIIKRKSAGGHTMVITPSGWEEYKARDIFHLYTVIAALIYGPIILYANLVVGPATLAEIPEGYNPKHWEYYKHPISRFLQRYCYTDPQINHEVSLHYLYQEDELMKIRALDEKVKRVMKRRKDYEAYYYRPVSANWMRIEKKDSQLIWDVWSGDNLQEQGYSMDFKDTERAIEREFIDEYGGVVPPA